MSKKIEKPVEGGLIYGLSYDEYAALPAVNYSILKHFEKSALQARQEMTQPKDSTPAMDFGNAVHALILEPERFEKEFICAPKCDKRTNAGKAEWLEFENNNRGKIFVIEPEWQQCHQIAAAVRKHKLAGQLATLPGKCEVSATWIDSETGVKCRCRMDKFMSFMGWPVVIDLKTTENASKRAFRFSIFDYWYHAQAAFYMDGLSEIHDAERRHFIIAAEKKPPFDVVVYEMDDGLIDEGRAAYKRWLKRYKECMDTNTWPGISDGLESIGLKREI